MIEISEELQSELKRILSEIENEDKPVRERQLRQWKGLELYWKHIQDIFWDSIARDYRSTTSIISNENQFKDLDPYYSDKIINIYRAHGESIIAALSQDIPQTAFVPEDADKIEDVKTAGTWTKISELINRHNKAILLLIRGLYLIYNQGIICGYIYAKEDAKSTYKVPQYGKRNIDTHYSSCPVCGSDLDVVSDSEPMMEAYCEDCGQTVEPIIDTDSEEVPTIKGFLEEKKKRPCIEFYGPLNVKIPHYARTQQECGYIILETEAHESYAQEVSGDDTIVGKDDDAEYERWARSATDEPTKGLVTFRRIWLRTWELNRIKDKDRKKELKKLFPKGCYFLLMGDKFIECDSEDMDDCWEISSSPISSHIHAEPMGQSIKSVQDIRSEIVTLELQSMEYGIPETFADPGVLDFDAYAESENAPGAVFPAKAPAGRSLGDGFTTLKTATFPKESAQFKKDIDQDGQFVLGSFPSIYGGPAQGGSKTYAEYAASRSQALQRLSVTWKLVSMFWAEVMHKAVRTYVNNMVEDEKIVEKKGQTWVNIWIRRSEMIGKIGSVQPETDNMFPMSWSQKHDALVKLLEFQIPAIMDTLTHPENAGVVAKYLGFPEMYIPGEDDRSKQLSEIQDLLEAEPIENIDGSLTPTIPVDFELDKHELELEVGQAWLKSDAGLDAKINNPAGYMNVRSHISQHQQAFMMQQSQMMEQQNESNSGTRNKSQGSQKS